MIKRRNVTAAAILLVLCCGRLVRADEYHISGAAPSTSTPGQKANQRSDSTTPAPTPPLPEASDAPGGGKMVILDERFDRHTEGHRPLEANQPLNNERLKTEGGK